MGYEQDACYMTLVEELRRRYRRRSQTVSQLIEERDLAGIAARREALLSAFRAQLLDGALPVSPAQPVCAGRLELAAYTIEKIRLQGVEGAPIPVHLYLPRGGAERHPAVLVTIGHWLQAKQMVDIQLLCANLAEKGIAAITFDPIYQGERCPFGAAELEAMFGPVPEDMGMVGLHMFPGNLAYLLGRNVGALFVREAQCVLDYLCARPEIDPERIAAAGQSGGGTQACYLAALDSRVRLYAPVQCLSRLSVTLEGGIGDCEQSLSGISRDSGTEQCDVLWAAAPKPVLQSAGEFDFFALEGAYAVAGEMAGLYRVLGQGEDYRLQVASCAHELSEETRRHLYGWLTERFFGYRDDGERVKTTLKPEDLRCLAERPDQGPEAAYRRALRDMAQNRPREPEVLRERLGALLGLSEEPLTFAVHEVEIHENVCQQLTFSIHLAYNRSVFCRLVPGEADLLRVAVVPRDFVLADAGGPILYVTPWAMDAAFRKERMGYDLETCLFNAAAVLGENLAVERTAQILAAVEQGLRFTGASKAAAAALGPAGVPLLLAACIDRRISRLALAGCQLSLDDLFQGKPYFLQETGILPGLLELADLPDLCALTEAVVLPPRGPDNRPLTQEEVRREKRVRCLWCEDAVQGLSQWLEDSRSE